MKPIIIAHSGLTNRIFALRRYTTRNDGTVISSIKDEVTKQAIQAVLEHRIQGCELEDCLCRHIEVRSVCGIIYPVPVPGEVVKNCERPPRHSGQHKHQEIEW